MARLDRVAENLHQGPALFDDPPPGARRRSRFLIIFRRFILAALPIGGCQTHFSADSL